MSPEAGGADLRKSGLACMCFEDKVSRQRVRAHLHAQKKVNGPVLAQVTAERASAVRRLSAAEATATQAFEEVGEMRDALADLRERLAQARPHSIF